MTGADGTGIGGQKGDGIMATGSIDTLSINTIRTLSMDAVQKANSGHPGLPMGAAPMAYVLWTRFLRHNPGDPRWPGRDRFVLSAGHGSMLLYSMLHLCGYLPLDELKHFRQLHSLTPGHPEYGLTPGVEATTGPLGQGFAMGVGMAMAAEHLSAQYNRPGFDLFPMHIYGLVSDGDIMEGISAEAASLAGHLGLGRLVYLYDDNHISLDGPTDLSFGEDVLQRFAAYGWHTQRVEDGNDLEALAKAIEAARSESALPSIIAVRTHIGYGSPHLQDTSKAHGSPLGPEEVRLTKRFYGWPEDAEFLVPPEVSEHFAALRPTGAKRQAEWEETLRRYAERYPQEASELRRVLAGELPTDWAKHLPTFGPADAQATRAASGKVLGALGPVLPELFGGSADLSGSNDTTLKDAGIFARGDRAGRNIYYGVREHAMGAAMNGIALFGGLRPYGGTFMTFSDYMRGSIRLAALQGLGVVYVFTHDSIGLGEDGPTHQPIEHLAALRAIPNLIVIRPADGNEVAAAWTVALGHTDGPTALVLSRQKLPVVSTPEGAAVRHGAYILREAAGGPPELILMGSGSEVGLIVAAAEQLSAAGRQVRVVSVPSMELFRAQPREYRESVLPRDCRHRLAVEAGVPMPWWEFVGSDGDILGLDHFGASAPAEALFREFGFTVENVVARASALLR